MADSGLDVLKSELGKKRSEVQALEQAISVLEGSAILITGAGASVPTRRDFEDLGIADAAKRFIKEIGRPASTREIADALLSRGLKTKSRNYVATVYSTLDNSKTITRTPDGSWNIKDETH